VRTAQDAPFHPSGLCPCVFFSVRFEPAQMLQIDFEKKVDCYRKNMLKINLSPKALSKPGESKG
jgi:hypothetical protein